MLNCLYRCVNSGHMCLCLWLAEESGLSLQIIIIIITIIIILITVFSYPSNYGYRQGIAYIQNMNKNITKRSEKRQRGRNFFSTWNVMFWIFFFLRRTKLEDRQSRLAAKRTPQPQWNMQFLFWQWRLIPNHLFGRLQKEVSGILCYVTRGWVCISTISTQSLLCMASYAVCTLGWAPTSWSNKKMCDEFDCTHWGSGIHICSPSSDVNHFCFYPT